MHSKKDNLAVSFKITGNWNLQSKRLKETYSQLSDADLTFESGKENELLLRLGKKLGKSRDQVIDIIRKDQQKRAGIDKAKAFIIVEVTEYVPGSVSTQTIMKKATGNVTAISFDSGETLAEKASPFDTFIQVIDGKAEIVIDDTSHMLETGQAIVVPAHSRNTITANERFKMLSTVIKSGYEDVSL